jgi:hypothetical protein
MPTARVQATRLAARAGLACCLILALLWTAKIALSQGGVASHWEQEPSPVVSRWYPLFDGEITFCLEDRAGVGVDNAWVQSNLSQYWGANAHALCLPGIEPDVRIIVQDLEAPQPAGWSRADYPVEAWRWFTWRLYQHCEITVNAQTFYQRNAYVWPGTSQWLPDVPEKTLLHEFGHCAGLPHREDDGYQGSMYPVMLYYPTADEATALKTQYNLPLLVRLMRPFVRAWGMAAGGA